MNKHLKCAIKVPLTAMLMPVGLLLMIIAVFLSIPLMAVQASGCADIQDDVLMMKLFALFDWWHGL